MLFGKVTQLPAMPSALLSAPPEAAARPPRRFHKTVLNELYRVAFRKKVYCSIDELQADLDVWILTVAFFEPTLRTPDARIRVESAANKT